MLKRLLATAAVLGLVALVIGLRVGWLVSGQESSDAASDPTRITHYDAEFTIDAQGTMRVAEELRVDFPQWESRHGIFRFFDIADPSQPQLRRIPADVAVTMDAGRAPVQWSTTQGGRIKVLRIGDPEVYVTPGEHVYDIDYTIDSVLATHPDDPAESVFYWNLIPGGATQAIDRATLKVTFPAPLSEAVDPQCAVGWGSRGGCVVEPVGKRVVEIKVADLAPQTPVTLRAVIAQPAPQITGKLPWAQAWDPALGTQLWQPAAALLAALATLLWGWRYGSRGIEPTPPYPLTYAPPQDLGPAQAAMILDEHVDRSAFVASLLHAAERGQVALSHEQRVWSISRSTSPEPTRLDPVTQSLLDGLVPVPGGSFEAAAKNTRSGEILRREVAALQDNSVRWATEAGYLAGTRGMAGAAFWVLCGLFLAGAVIFMDTGLPWIVAMIPAAFTAGALPAVARGAATHRTQRGRELWSQIGGFRRILSTPSSEARFDFAGRENLYAAYLPYAVAFGVADAWAKKFRTEMGREPSVPSYFGFYGGMNAGAYVDQALDSFDHTVDSAIGAYTAAQARSSGGGGGGFSGGFSGGGGGGGGGTGSW